MNRVTAPLPARDDAPTRELEPLDRYATAGGMAPDRIRRILADVAMQLGDLHRAGRAHGGISPATIGLDASGQARLLTPPVAPAANAEDAVRREGYAAFEQYTDDPDTPCGPWTDIYALSATACALLTGLAPPSALARLVHDEYIPLAQRRGQDEYAFCAVLDSGLALDAYARPQTIDEFARALHLDVKTRMDAVPADAANADINAASASIVPPSPEATGSAAADTSESPMSAPVAHDGADRVTPPHVVSGMAFEDRRTTLEDSDGLEATSAWACERGDYGAANAAFNEPAYPSAEPLASVPASSSRTLDSEEATHPTIPIAPVGNRTAPRKRAPLLLVLAVIAMVAFALYAWLRPQPTRQPDVVASSPSNPAAPIASSANPATPSSASTSIPKPVPPRADSQAPVNAGTQTTTVQLSASPGFPAAGAGAPNPPTSAATTPGSEVQNGQGGSPAAAPPAASAAAPAPAPAPALAPAPGSALALAPAPGSAPGSAPAPSTSTASAGNPSAEPAGSLGQGSAASPAPAAPSSNGTSSVASSVPTASATSTGTGTAAGTTPAFVANAPRAGSPNEKSAAAQNATAKPRAANKTPVPVTVAIRPWGEVLVDGRSLGASPPLRSLTLPPGKYSITIRNNADPDHHQTLEVTAGQSASISYNFQK